MIKLLMLILWVIIAIEAFLSSWIIGFLVVIIPLIIWGKDFEDWD